MHKILVVDDDLAVCSMLEEFLNGKGYQASVALSGQEGLEKLEKEKPQIVLLDIKMPHMDGIETLKKIREVNKEVGVVMITAVKENEVARKCIELGAYDYIVKPLGLEYLENVLLVKLLDFKCQNAPSSVSQEINGGLDSQSLT